ncbi:Pectinesterase [Heracleum sosnowskyi]|uniref:Pectinesterase n=1 Tax=Heracleum sosnowskyi TaxID=360622 RepID=A0AAD8MN62_9APIA|nr:Pectinesterase [Heracleum sosnowskyi]
MATNIQPLLQQSTTTKPFYKAAFVFLSLFAVISPVAFVSYRLFNASSTSLSSRICDQAHDQILCQNMVSQVTSSGSVQINDVVLLQMLLQKSESHVRDAVETASDVKNKINDAREQVALADCLQLLDMSNDSIVDSIQALGRQTLKYHFDAHTWLSAALTNYVTCLDGLNGASRPIMEPKLNDLISRARIYLAMVVAISPSREYALEFLHGDFPSWITSRDRKLLRSMPNEINADVVVAKDGSGNYKTVKEAVAAAPDKSKSRYVIYVKKGIYKENVDIGKSKQNIMLTGDGMDATIITGSLNVIDGATTFSSATVAAVGFGFMAQDIGFQNTAGPEKHQAVALRVGADQSVINRCRIDAYQDTLYTHNQRQFYRDCYITGTVDFIFGNAAVVFQNSNIVARKPMDNQKNMLTAQGKTDLNQNTGTSIQNCDVYASADLYPVRGWAEWNGDFALKTLYYGEYMNRGPGAGTSGRVKWPGYHVITSATEASKFTVTQLIQGGAWLKSTGVTYTEGL